MEKKIAEIKKKMLWLALIKLYSIDLQAPLQIWAIRMIWLGSFAIFHVGYLHIIMTVLQYISLGKWYIKEALI